MTDVLDVHITSKTRALVAGNPVAKGRHPDIRAAAMAVVQKLAQDQGQDLEVLAVDDLKGAEFRIVVQADGKIRDASEPPTAPPFSPPPAATNPPAAEPVAAPKPAVGTVLLPPAAPRVHTGTAAGPIIVPDPADDAAIDAAQGKTPTAGETLVEKAKALQGVPYVWGKTPEPASNEVAKREAPAQPAVGYVRPPLPKRDPGKPVPTYEDLLEQATPPRVLPAEFGWRSWFHLGPGRAELERRGDIQQITRPLDGCKNIVVINPKGGVGKTTAVRQLARTFGYERGGYVLAWDNNETKGNLGRRTLAPSFTVLDLLRDLDRFENSIDSRVGDLSNYVRSQGGDKFDVLASATTTRLMATIGEAEFGRLDRVFDRFYRIKVIDTGNNPAAPNYLAAVASADQLVIVSEIAEDAIERAADVLEDLRPDHGDLISRSVVALSQTARPNKKLEARVTDYFQAHTRSVRTAPFDPSLVGGRLIQQPDLSRATVRAWERIAADVAVGL